MFDISFLTSSVLFLVAAVSQVAVAEGAVDVPRENIEWFDVWIPSASNQTLPRVLLVGDSITKGYYGGVEKGLGTGVACARFATSACVSDPAFMRQLDAVLLEYSFDVIHFNNGLHGMDFSEANYVAAYERAILHVRELQSDATIICVLSTPAKSGTEKEDAKNVRMVERNRRVQEVAEKYDLAVNDLYTPMLGHPEYYTDTHHYKDNAKALQSRQVVEAVKQVLPATL